MLDNSAIIAAFCPPFDDGDTFVYTEMLDRGKRKGNNGHRLLKTFYHRSVEEFWEQLPVIKRLCDLSGIRACTRLSPKSFAQVGAQHTRMVIEAALTQNWMAMKSLYNRACGITTPIKKIWLLDVDVVKESTLELGNKIEADGNLLAHIPSKKGVHFIIKPFDVRTLESYYQNLGINLTVGIEEVSLHKDNPTNLYIPDGAD
jgi:hypothetical protein